MRTTFLCTNLSLVGDGPYVNKAIMRKIEQTIKNEHPEFKGFGDLGSCVLHVVHNGFGKGLEMYGKGMISYAWIFVYSAARREDYQQLQANLCMSQIQECPSPPGNPRAFDTN